MNFQLIEKVKTELRERVIWYTLVTLFIGVCAGVFLARFYKESSVQIVENISESEDTSNLRDDVNGEIYVDLSGAVNSPGVYKLHQNDIVADALLLGGGVLESGSEGWLSRSLDLSKKLGVSQKLYIPFEWEIAFYNLSPGKISVDPINPEELYTPKINESSESDSDLHEETEDSGGEDDVYEDDAGESGKNSKGLVNINTSGKDALMELTGIGEVYSQKILDNRPFENFEDLADRSGISKSTLDKFKSEIEF